MTSRFRILVAVGAGTALLVSLLLAVTVGGAAGQGSAKPKPRKVEFNVTAMELKGSTTTDKLAPPTSSPKDLSDGYGFKKPGEADAKDPNKWEVSSYAWNPGSMTVCKGDAVTLRIFVTNGDEHKTWVEAPNGATAVKEQLQNRGREYVVNFVAKQAGIYRLMCDNHDPTMRANIFVLSAC